MSEIDFITAVLSVPLADPAAGPDSALLTGEALEQHFRRLDETVAALCERPAGSSSRLDGMFTMLLEQGAVVDGVQFTSYEKKGTFYPAIVIEAAGVLDPAGRSLSGEITRCFSEPGTRTLLAEMLGTELGVDWVSIFTTFGPSR